MKTRAINSPPVCIDRSLTEAWEMQSEKTQGENEINQHSRHPCSNLLTTGLREGENMRETWTDFERERECVNGCWVLKQKNNIKNKSLVLREKFLATSGIELWHFRPIWWDDAWFFFFSFFFLLFFFSLAIYLLKSTFSYIFHFKYLKIKNI